MSTQATPVFVCETKDRVCRSCGCHDYDACVVTKAPGQAWNQPGQPCWWVESDLCSACSDRIDPRLTWHHGGNHPEELPWTHKLVFAWAAFVALLAGADLIGLLG